MYARTARVWRAILVGALAATTVGVVAVPAAAAEGETAACDLSPAGDLDRDNEKRGCLRVTATLSQAPAVGQRASLAFTVDAAVPVARARISADLPPGLRWVTVPAGMAQSSFASRAPHLNGVVRRAGLTRALAAGQRLRYEGVVEAVTAGPAEISITAVDPARAARDGGADTVQVTVGATAADTRMGIAVDRNAGVTALTGPAARPLTAGKKQARLSGARPAAAESPNGTACAAGTWNYTDRNGVGRPGVSWLVEAWDRDNTGGDDLLASGLTGFNGEYTLCFNNGDEGTVGQDLYVRFVAQNNNWRVQTADGWIYNYTTAVDGEVVDGTTTDFGWLQPGDPTHMRAAAAFAATQVTWNNIPGACWDMVGPCKTVVILWSPDSTDGTYYSLGTDDIHLAAADPDEPMVVSHEVTHAIMDDVFDDAYPSFPNCSPHWINRVSSDGCAWTEGFAEWVPLMVFGSSNFVGVNMETPTWGTANWGDGVAVEGRVAGALWDLSDADNEGTDRVAEGINNIWTTFQNHNSGTFAQFWSDRAADGFNVDNNALGSLYQNTIDFGFAG
jgi:hypothetical protein